jgi:hypothetical protein
MLLGPGLVLKMNLGTMFQTSHLIKNSKITA